MNKGEKPYYQFTLTWADALETIRRVHGDDAVTAFLEELAEPDVEM